MAWSIELYESSTGQKPVGDFVRSLQDDTQAKLLRQIKLLEEFGPQTGMPHAKPLGGGLYELRVRGKQEVRILYIFVRRSTIYLLHGFLKKTDAIPDRELKIAKDRKREIKN